MTKYLTAVDFGISGTIAAYTGIISAFSVLGLGVVLMNTFYKFPDTYKDIWRQIYGFLNIWMIVFAVLQAAVLFIFIPKEAADNKWWIILLTNFSNVFFGPTATIGNAYYIYHKESLPIVWRSVLSSIISIATNFLLIVGLKWGYMGWYVGSFAGTFFSNASYWYVVRYKMGIRPTFRIDKKVIRHALSVSLPTIPHYYSSYLLEGSGRMVMDQYKIGQDEIGKVSINQQIGDLFQQGMAGFNNAVSPFIMQALKDHNDKRIHQITLLFTSLIFAVAFVISLWSKEIMHLLISNDSLASSYKYLVLYLMALCYRPMYLTVSSYFFYYEKTTKLLLVTFMSGIIALVLYVILTPMVGAWGFFIGHYIACIYYGYGGYFFKVYKENAPRSMPVLIIVAIQILLTAGALFSVDHIILKSVLSGIFIMSILIIAYIKRNEIKQFI